MKLPKLIKINPVAKNANKFNQSRIMRDRKNDYSRKVKFKTQLCQKTF